MANKFGIKVLCAQCGKDDFLASDEEEGKPLLFDTPEAALEHARSLSKKQAGTFKSADSNPLYECPNPDCGVISPMYDLQLNVARYRSGA